MKGMSQYVLAPAYKIYAIIIVSSTSQKSNNMPVHSCMLPNNDQCSFMSQPVESGCDKMSVLLSTTAMQLHQLLAL